MDRLGKTRDDARGLRTASVVDHNYGTRTRPLGRDRRKASLEATRPIMRHDDTGSATNLDRASHTTVNDPLPAGIDGC